LHIPRLVNAHTQLLLHPITKVSVVVDATDISSHPPLQQGSFTKVFSNAAMHWILRTRSERVKFFHSVREALQPNGIFVFEMGGFGNISELRMALLMATSRRVGLETATNADPWFFPDEKWITETMEREVGGWKIERIETEWRPTPADEAGIDGWLRLMGQSFFDVVPAVEREECIKEAVTAAQIVCTTPSGGEMLNYIRLRCKARKL
jgi:SAM-dependent methyltransferase